MEKSAAGINMSSVKDEKKPAKEGLHITLKVTNQKGNEVRFRVKRNTQLRKLVHTYCKERSMATDTFVFLFEGRKLPMDRTPDELEMEDGDEIDVMLHQDGGAASYLSVTM